MYRRNDQGYKITMLIFAAVPVLLGILAFFGVREYRDLNHSSTPISPASPTAPAATETHPSTDPTPPQQSEEQDLPSDGTSHTATLTPSQTDHSWLFRSPTDHKQWIELKLWLTDHNTEMYVSVDSPNGSRVDTVGVSDNNQGRRILRQAGSILLTLTLTDVRLGPDTDPVKPVSGNVFQQISCRVEATQTATPPNSTLIPYPYPQ